MISLSATELDSGAALSSVLPHQSYRRYLATLRKWCPDSTAAAAERGGSSEKCDLRPLGT